MVLAPGRFTSTCARLPILTPKKTRRKPRSSSSPTKLTLPFSLFLTTQFSLFFFLSTKPNSSICKGGKWACTTKECASTCSLWGDNHFTTFDGREFDFQGVCSYVLSKGRTNIDGDGFAVTIQNVLCGSNGVTCSKTLTINLVGDEPESITLSSESPVPGIKGLMNGMDVQRHNTFLINLIKINNPHLVLFSII